MKKILMYCMLLVGTIPIAAQEKKPTLMIVPSDNWCVQRYFTTTYQDQGTTVRLPDYKLAFQEDAELSGVISKIGSMLTNLGYSLKDCEQEIKALSLRMAENSITMSKTGKASFVETPLDILKQRVKSDIIIQLGWQVNRESQGKSVTFILEAFDAYTSKRIATASGISEASNEIIPRLLENAVKSHIGEFDRQMDAYFRNVRVDGREIILTIQCWNNWENDLETEYGGEELTDCIQQWLSDHTVKKSFNLTDATENFARFEQVRIPLFDAKGNALDARSFATELRKYLQRPPYGITSKVMTRGLGEAIIVLGEK